MHHVTAVVQQNWTVGVQGLQCFWLGLRGVGNHGGGTRAARRMRAKHHVYDCPKRCELGILFGSPISKIRKAAAYVTFPSTLQLITPTHNIVVPLKPTLGQNVRALGAPSTHCTLKQRSYK